VAELPDVYLRFVDADPSTGSSVTPVVIGDSMDTAFPGRQGWLGISRFAFGFGWGGSDSERKSAVIAKKLSAGEKLTKEEAAHITSAKDGKGAKPAASQGTLQPDKFTFSRSPSLASITLADLLRKGDKIPNAEVVACRAAGADTETTDAGEKIPFLRLIFGEVYLKSCKLSVTREQEPSENLEFKFGKVMIETIWTDNATGNRDTGGVLNASFDFDNATGSSSWGENA
jgi:type VI protein secretion system component Hcp